MKKYKPLVHALWFTFWATLFLGCPSRAQVPRGPLHIRRTTTAQMPLLLDGQLAYATDTKRLWIGSLNGNICLSLPVVGPAGKDGKDGANGANGVSPTLSIGTVTPLFTSATPTASLAGAQANPTLNLGLPAAPFVFMASVPPVAVAEIGTNKSASFAFPAALPDTDYAYFVQIMGGTGIVTSITWTEVSKTTTGLTLNVKSSVAVLAGTTRVWVMVAHKNTP